MSTVPAAELLGDLGGCSVVQGELHLWMVAMERDERLGQPWGVIDRRRHPDHPAGAVEVLRDRRPGLRDLAQDGAGVYEELGARRRRLNALGSAAQQRQAELGLQPRDLL